MERLRLTLPIPPVLTGDQFERLILECGFENIAAAARFFDTSNANWYALKRKRNKPLANGKLLAALLICYRDCLNRQIADEQAQLDATNSNPK